MKLFFRAKNPFLNLGVGLAFAFAVGLTGVSLVTLLESRLDDSSYTDKQIWGTSSRSEREALNEDMQLYRKLWKKNRSQILEKINAEYQEFKNSSSKA